MFNYLLIFLGRRRLYCYLSRVLNQTKAGHLLFFFSTKYHFLLTARETSGFRRHIFCLFSCLFLALLGLCCYAWPFSSFGGLRSRATQVVVCRLLIAVASLVEEQGLQDPWASVGVAYGLSLLWDLARPGIKPVTLCCARVTLNHWTTTEACKTFLEVTNVSWSPQG